MWLIKSEGNVIARANIICKDKVIGNWGGFQELKRKKNVAKTQ